MLKLLFCPIKKFVGLWVLLLIQIWIKWIYSSLNFGKTWVLGNRLFSSKYFDNFFSKIITVCIIWQRKLITRNCLLQVFKVCLGKVYAIYISNADLMPNSVPIKKLAKYQERAKMIITNIFTDILRILHNALICIVPILSWVIIKWF